MRVVSEIPVYVSPKRMLPLVSTAPAHEGSGSRVYDSWEAVGTADCGFECSYMLLSCSAATRTQGSFIGFDGGIGGDI